MGKQCRLSKGVYQWENNVDYQRVYQWDCTKGVQWENNDYQRVYQWENNDYQRVPMGKQ